MSPSPQSTQTHSQYKTSPNPIKNCSLTSRSCSQSCAKQSKIKPLNQLISMRQNHHKILSIKQPNALNNSTVLTKQINLNPKNHQSIHLKNIKSKRNSNSKTKLHVSIKKSNQKYQTPLQMKKSSQNLESGIKKQKISILSKIQTLKGISYNSVQPIVDIKQKQNEHKQKLQQNYSQRDKIALELKRLSDFGLEERMYQKMNGNKNINGPRTIKTTRQIIQMKESHKEKEKIKIKLQKKTINHPFRF